MHVTRAQEQVIDDARMGQWYDMYSDDGDSDDDGDKTGGDEVQGTRSSCYGSCSSQAFVTKASEEAVSYFVCFNGSLITSPADTQNWPEDSRERTSQVNVDLRPNESQAVSALRCSVRTEVQKCKKCRPADEEWKKAL